MKTQELRDDDLDSIWTPVVNLVEFGLHPDSRRTPQSCLEYDLPSRTRAI